MSGRVCGIKGYPFRVFWLHLTQERIPHFPETESLIVLYVDRGEFGDALADQGQGGAGIIKAPEGEVPAASLLPE